MRCCGRPSLRTGCCIAAIIRAGATVRSSRSTRERQGAAARLVARHGARHQRDHAHHLQRRDVSRESRRRDPGDRCADGRTDVGVSAHPIPPPTQFPRASASASAASRSMASTSSSRPGTISSWRSMRAPAGACGRAIAAATSTSEFQRADRRERHGRRGEHVPGRALRLLRHRPRREDRRGAVAQRDDPETGEPGDETWGGAPMEKRWMTGVWGQLTYDPALDLVFYGSSGAGPASEVQRGTIGGTMAGTNTRWAVTPRTGEIVVAAPDIAARQLGPGMHVRDDDHQDAGQSRRECRWHAGGRSRCAARDAQDATGVPCKTGIAWSFDAADRRVPVGEADGGAEHRLAHRRQGSGERERGPS